MTQSIDFLLDDALARLSRPECVEVADLALALRALLLEAKERRAYQSTPAQQRAACPDGLMIPSPDRLT